MWLYFFTGATVMADVLVFGVFVWLFTIRRPGFKKHTIRQREYEQAILELMNERTVLARQRTDDVAETNRILLLIFESVVEHNR